MMQEFVQSVKDTARKATEDMHTAVPATITSYDPSSGMAVVQPKAKFKKPNGETMDYPSVSGVPVVFPQSQNVTIAFPVKAGDGCLLVFSETAIDYWLYGKETATDLKFDLSSAIAIPNIAASGNDAMVEACAEDAVVVKASGTKLKVKSDGVYITGNLKVEGSIQVTQDVVANGSVSLGTHTHRGDSGGTTSAPT